jgi:hypothetical protein
MKKPVKDYYEKMKIEQINIDIAAFLKETGLHAGSVGNFNLYKLLYAYFGSQKRREEINKFVNDF